MFLFFLFLFATTSITLSSVRAQQQTSEWAAYTSTKLVNRVLVLENAVWSATSGGVLLFDQTTQTYTRFTRLNGLAGNKVLSMATDARNHLWFGTDREGLSRYRPETGNFDPPFLDFKDLRIQTLVAAEDRIFVGMDKGISAFLIDKEEVKETYRTLGSFTKDTAVNALVLFGGKLWAGTSEGLAWADLNLPNLQDPDSWFSNYNPLSVKDMVVFNDTLFVASRSGIFAFDAEGKNLGNKLARTGIRSLGIFNGKVVLGTEIGEFFRRLGPGTWQSFRSPSSIKDVRALSRVDSVLWVATAEGLQVVGAPPPPPPREPTGNQFYEVEINGDEVWVASVPSDQVANRFGIYQFDGTGWIVHNTKNGLPSNIAVALQRDKDGQLWVGTWGKGIAVLDSSGTWRRLKQDNSVLDGIGSRRDFVAISEIIRDSQGRMWIANVLIGLAVMDGYPPTHQHIYDQDDLGLPIGVDIGNLAIASDGLKWISTPRAGFVLFDDGGTPFQSGDEFSLVLDTGFDSRMTSDRTSCIAVDATGQVWVGTDNGLNAVRGSYSRSSQNFQLETWRVYNTSNGLPAGTISALETDSQGNIWVGTEAGLTQIGPNGEIAINLTTANSGLINNRVNSLSFDDEKGELWIGTLDGLSRLQITPTQNGEPSSLAAYPNPFFPGANRNSMRFAGLPLGASMRIFTLNGTLIKVIEGEPGSATIEWNGQTASGFLVGSGIYFFIAEDEAGNQVKGKFAVIQ